MLKDFKAFLLRGNVVDLAVAVVIGAAFGAVVTALVADILTPIIAAIIGKQDFSNLTFTHQLEHVPLRRVPQRGDRVHLHRGGGVLLRRPTGERPDAPAQD